MSSAYRFVLSQKDVILRYVAPMPVLILAAPLLTAGLWIIAVGIVYVVLGPRLTEVSLPSVIFFVLILFCWAALLYWATSTGSTERAIARAFWAFCTGVLLVPVMIIVPVVLGPPQPTDSSDPIIPAWMFQVFISVAAVVIGFVLRAAAVLTSPEGSPEKSGGIWYVFRPIGGGYFVLVVGLLLIGALVLRLNGYEGLLS